MNRHSSKLSLSPIKVPTHILYPAHPVNTFERDDVGFRFVEKILCVNIFVALDVDPDGLSLKEADGRGEALSIVSVAYTDPMVEKRAALPLARFSVPREEILAISSMNGAESYLASVAAQALLPHQERLMKEYRQASQASVQKSKIDKNVISIFGDPVALSFRDRLFCRAQMYGEAINIILDNEEKVIDSALVSPKSQIKVIASVPTRHPV